MMLQLSLLKKIHYGIHLWRISKDEATNMVKHSDLKGKIGL